MRIRAKPRNLVAKFAIGQVANVDSVKSQAKYNNEKIKYAL